MKSRLVVLMDTRLHWSNQYGLLPCHEAAPEGGGQKLIEWLGWWVYGCMYILNPGSEGGYTNPESKARETPQITQYDTVG